MADLKTSIIREGAVDLAGETAKALLTLGAGG